MKRLYPWLIATFFILALIPQASAQEIGVFYLGGDNEPFCGNCLVEKSDNWDETTGQVQACKPDLGSQTYVQCTNYITPADKYELGAECQNQRGEIGMCAKENHCQTDAIEFIGNQTKIHIVTPKVAVGQGVDIKIFDPGRVNSTTLSMEAYVKRINPDRSSVYLSNFCNGTCFSDWLEKDSSWEGYTVFDMPGLIINVSDFNESFFNTQNVSANAERYWFETKNSAPSLQSFLAIDEPGDYAIEIIDARGNRIASDPFTVCADINNCEPQIDTSPICRSTLIIPEREQIPIDGTIEDGNDYPVPDLRIFLIQDDKEIAETQTDENGHYSFADEDFNSNEPIRLRFVFMGESNQYGDRFYVSDGRVNPSEAAFVTTRSLFASTFHERIFELDDILRMQGFNTGGNIWHNLDNIADTDDFARTHFYIAKAMAFAEDELGVIMNFQRPLEFRLYGQDSGVFYRRSEHLINVQEGNIGNTDSKWTDRQSPDNTQWHEFSHAMMRASNIGGFWEWPESIHGRLEWNHLGYANPSTTDSWTEGFAVWMSAVIADELFYNNFFDTTDNPWLYRVGSTTTINLEDDIKAWDSLGRREDVAAAALLWDLYDSGATYGGGNRDDDNIFLKIEDLWPLLHQENIVDMKSVYDAISARYIPGSIGQDNLDQIFIAHGFFVDEDGDQFYDDGEEVGRSAYGGAGFRVLWDLNSDGTLNSWETGAPEGEFVYVDDQQQHRFSSHLTTDFNDHYVFDLNGDGSAEVTESPFYVYPDEDRRDTPEFLEETLTVNIRDKYSNPVAEAELKIEIQYDSPNEYRNFSYNIPLKGDDQLALWVPSGAKAVITAVAGTITSPSFTITDDQFQNNITPGGNQGEQTFTLPTSAQEVADNIGERPFSDVPSSHPNFDAITHVKDKGIVVGYENGTFQPDIPINRAEFSKIIIEAVYEDITGENCFPDVKLEWFARFICFAHGQGILDGHPDGNFKPGDNINFAEAAKIIIESYEFETTPSGEWFRPFVDALKLHNSIPTTVDRLDKQITRGEMAEMIYRIDTGTLDKPSRNDL